MRLLHLPNIFQVLLVICKLVSSSDNFLSAEHWPDSVVSHTAGHYPHIYCQITNAYLSWENRTFYYKSKENLHSPCIGVSSVWDISHVNAIDTSCHETYDLGYAFTIYATYGGNYFHLHYDMMIPLYKEIYHRRDGEPKNTSRIFLPTIESRRLQVQLLCHVIITGSW